MVIDKRDFIVDALNDEVIYNKWWLFALLSVVLTDPPETEFSIKYTNDGCYGYRNGEWHKFKDIKPNEPLVYPLEELKLKEFEFTNQPKAITTTYGNALFNARAIQYAFGDRIGFQTGHINIKKLESDIGKKTVDGHQGKDEVPNDTITIKMLMMDFGTAVADLNDIMDVIVVASTPKSLVTDPNMSKIRDKLIEENKNRLHDTAIIAQIDDKLKEVDAEWLKNDPAAKFSESKKAQNARKRMFSMFGAETGFDETGRATLVKNSLAEGWDVKSLPPMYNSLRAGSFFRGYETALGGESVKFFLSVFQNTAISMKDCGTPFTTTHYVDSTLSDSIVGMYELVGPKKFEPITKERADELVGKEVTRRSPRFCKASSTDYCDMCMGTINAQSPYGLGSRASEIGSLFMGIMMSAAHAKALQVAKLRYDKWLS